MFPSENGAFKECRWKPWLLTGAAFSTFPMHVLPLFYSPVISSHIFPTEKAKFNGKKKKKLSWEMNGLPLWHSSGQTFCARALKSDLQRLIFQTTSIAQHSQTQYKRCADWVAPLQLCTAQRQQLREKKKIILYSSSFKSPALVLYFSDWGKKKKRPGLANKMMSFLPSVNWLTSRQCILFNCLSWRQSIFITLKKKKKRSTIAPLRASTNSEGQHLVLVFPNQNLTEQLQSVEKNLFWHRCALIAT